MARTRLEESYKINDIHVHVGQCSGINQVLLPEDILDFKQQNNIEKILLLPTNSNPEESNKMVEFLVDNIPDTYGLHWFTKDTINRIKLSDKILGVKYHGAYTGYPVTDMNPHVLEALDSQKSILMVHCGRYLEASHDSKTSYKHVLELAQQYNNIKLIMAHMGGTDTTVCKMAIGNGAQYHNVYFDTSGITTPYIIEFATEELPITRILFGSDSPWCSFKAMYHTVNDAIISRLSKKDIFHDNFDLLLK